MKNARAKSNGKITMAAIRRYSRKIAERFQPDKIILFGSQARGEVHPDGDVDLMVIMPARNELDQAAKISWEVEAPFPMDLLVCKPRDWKLRLEDGEYFITDMNANGKVLYEKDNARVDQKDRGRSPRGRPHSSRLSSVIVAG
jgi:predicted nucleotidyltransferase